MVSSGCGRSLSFCSLSEGLVTVCLDVIWPTGIREQATANQFQNQQEFCDIKTRMAANHCETLAAIQANQAAIIGYMTQEKISGLERENAALTMQLSQNAQTRAIIEALSKTSTITPAA